MSYCVDRDKTDKQKSTATVPKTILSSLPRTVISQSVN